MDSPRTPHATPAALPDHVLVEGARVQLSTAKGTVRYVGLTAFSAGKWVGIELDEPVGKNNGIIKGTKYFDCAENFGVFVRPSQIKAVIGPDGAPIATPAPTASAAASPILTRSALPTAAAHDTSRRRSAAFQRPQSTLSATPPPPASSTTSPPTSDETKPSPPASRIRSAGAKRPLTPTKLPAPGGAGIPKPVSRATPTGLRRPERTASAASADSEEAQGVATGVTEPEYAEAQQQKLREADKALEEAKAKEQEFDEKYARLLEDLEMTTLDKEMAEEKIENLKLEVERLKEKVDELTVDLEAYTEEEKASFGSPVDSSKAPVRIVQLEKQNERLKEALVRLRELTNEQETDLQKKVKSLEGQLAGLLEVESANEKLQEEVKTYETTVEGLKAQLDDALGLEYLVLQLTEKNSSKSEKIVELQATVEHLETLKDLNDELEENHMEARKQMQAEIEQLNAVVREQQRQLDLAEESQADHEITVGQFRELVQHLQSDIGRLRRNQASQNNETKTLSSQSQAMLSINMQLQSSVVKAQAKSIDLELRKLDALQATEHLAYVKPYLPEAFRTEEQPIQCLLLFKRLAFKSDLILRHVEKEIKADDSSGFPPNDMNTDSSLFEALEKLAQLSCSARRIVVFMERCSVDSFISLGNVYHDLIGMERNLDDLLELQRKQEFRPADSLEILTRSITRLDRLAAQYVKAEDPALATHEMGSLAHVSEYVLDRVFSELEGVKRAVEKAGHADGEDTGRPEQGILTPLTNTMKTVKSCKVQARKLRRHVQELRDTHLHIKPSVLEDSRTSFAQLSKLLRLSNEMHATVMHLEHDGTRAVTFKQLYDMLDSSSDGGQAFAGLEREAASTFMNLDALNAVAGDADSAQEAESPQEPWITRAISQKKDASMNAETERNMKNLDEEVKQLLTSLKMKDQTIQEANVKIALVESKLEAAKQQADAVVHQETEIANLRRQEKNLEEAVDNLQSEVETLESENMQLKKMLRQGEKAVPFGSLRKSPSGEITGELTSDEGQGLHNVTLEIEHLKHAVRYLRSENNALWSRICRQDVVDIASTAPLARNDKEKMAKTASEVTTLLKDIWSASGSIKVVDLSASVSADGAKRPGWRSSRLTPDYQHHVHVSVMDSLFRRGEMLRDEMGKHRAKTAAAARNNSSGAPSPYIGRIRMPAAPNVPARRRCVLFGDYAEMRTVHDCFVK